MPSSGPAYVLPGLAIGFEEHRLPPLDDPDVLTRRQAERRSQPYRAAIVPPIASLPFSLASETLSEADDASAAIARFDAEFADFSAPFAAVLLRSESASSSQIEHLTSGARAIAEAEIDERAQGNAPLIVRNVRAMEAAIALSDSIDNDTIIEMHRELLSPSSPSLVGRYRNEQVWIGGAFPHDAAFVPPHHHGVAPAMDDLVAFTRRTDIPLLAHAALAHAQFETIHPFPDGNGRTGRALMHAMLRRGGLLRAMTVPVSSGLLSELDEYFAALDAYRQGDANTIVQVFAYAALAGLQNARRLADDLRRLQSRWAVDLAGLRADATARALATLSIELPVLNSRIALARTGASMPTVVHAFDQLVERGIMRAANSRQRNRVWLNGDVIDALDDFAARSGRRQT